MNSSIEFVGSAQWLKILQQQISSLRYGVVQIVVHDSQVVQIERTEKVRLQREETVNDRD